MGSESCHSPKHQGLHAKYSPSFCKVKTESTLEEGCIVVDVGTLPSITTSCPAFCTMHSLGQDD